MLKKIVVVISLFFIFDRFMHYKLNQVIATSKESILAHRLLQKRNQPRKALVAQKSKGCAATRT